MPNNQNTLYLALELLSGLDPDLWQIIVLSLYVSGCATALSFLLGGTVAGLTAISAFRGKRIFLTLLRTMTAMPAVVIGLIVYLMLSRSGPLGIFELLFSPTAMIIAQSLLLTPLIITLAHDIMEQRWSVIANLLRSYETGKLSCIFIVALETRILLLTVALTAFGRAISEMGAVMIVGGNIEGYTRVMTTAIALETSRGNLPLALGLGLILMLVALLINGLMTLLTASLSKTE